jgi:aryl-alcohol dehydrogenase-like predicted oxidoreductase
LQQFLRKGEQADQVVATLQKISMETGRSSAQVALAWLRYLEIPVIPIFGARRIPQFQDNLDSLTLAAGEKQVAVLNEARIELGFPHEFYERQIVKTFAYGGMREQILAA